VPCKGIAARLTDCCCNVKLILTEALLPSLIGLKAEMINKNDQIVLLFYQSLFIKYFIMVKMWLASGKYPLYF
jgi:hypothetical protein